jgi:hypothetical protein
MKTLSALVDVIKAMLKHRTPCVAYAKVRCREHAVVRRRKVIDRFEF